MDTYDALAKVVIIGDTAVGKTCLILRYTQDIFRETFLSTIGLCAVRCTVEILSKCVFAPQALISSRRWFLCARRSTSYNFGIPQARRDITRYGEVSTEEQRCVLCSVAKSVRPAAVMEVARVQLYMYLQRLLFCVGKAILVSKRKLTVSEIGVTLCCQLTPHSYRRPNSSANAPLLYC